MELNTFGLKTNQIDLKKNGKIGNMINAVLNGNKVKFINFCHTHLGRDAAWVETNFSPFLNPNNKTFGSTYQIALANIYVFLMFCKLTNLGLGLTKYTSGIVYILPSIKPSDFKKAIETILNPPETDDWHNVVYHENFKKLLGI